MGTLSKELDQIEGEIRTLVDTVDGIQHKDRAAIDAALEEIKKIRGLILKNTPILDQDDEIKVMDLRGQLIEIEANLNQKRN